MTKDNWITVRKEMLEFHVYNKALLESVERDSFLTQRPREPNIFFLFRNNSTATWLRNNVYWIRSNFDYNRDELNFFAQYQDYERPREEPIPFVDLPGIKLDPHQVGAVQTMLECERNCLFFGAGTGKTIMALNYIKCADKVEENAKFVVVTLKSVLAQYKEEAKLYLDEDTEVYFTNPESMHKLPDTKFTGVIFDESHRLKNMSTSIHKKALKLAEQSRDVYHFSGTPQDATRDEVMSQIRILVPHLVPVKTQFMERYFYLDDYFKPKFEKLKDELDEIIVRLTYGDSTDNILKDLPPETHYLIECKFKDKTNYNAFDTHHTAIIDGVEYVADSRGSAIAILKQMSSGFIYEWQRELYEVEEPNKTTGKPDIIEKVRKIRIPHRLENPKQEAFREIIDELDSALIFTRFDEEQEIIKETLDDLNVSYDTINGSKTDKQNLVAEKAFKAGEIQFLVVQVKKGSAGLHFVITNNIIYYSIPDSFITYDQSKYRIRRRGTTAETCNYYSLVVKGTEDRKSIARISRKLKAHDTNFILFRRKKDGIV